MFCQRCRTPLHLDSSLENLSPAAIDLLSNTSTNPQRKPFSQTILPSRPVFAESQKKVYDEASKQSATPLAKRTVPSTSDPFAPSRGHGVEPGASFIMLSDSQVTLPPPASRTSVQTQTHGARPPDGIAPDLDLTNHLFAILSSRSDIDHPVCAECTAMLLEGMEKRLTSATKERDAYVNFLKKSHANVPSDDEEAAAKRELEKLKLEEQHALEELETLEAEKAALDQEAAALELETLAVDREEDQFWRERNLFAQSLAGFQEERDSVNQRYDHDARLLERLQRTNVYNDTFNISHDGSFGTINGLRLGRHSNVTVEWAEINAAWGQACLLLATIADKLNFQFQGYKLNPLGSTSTIDKFELPAPRGGGSQSSKSASVTSLPLYHSSDLPITLNFLHRNFDNAMVAFLDCLRQLGKHVQRITQGTTTGGESGLELPYMIKRDKIDECSIKLGSGFGGEETWSKACKLTLTCCKYLLAATSNIHQARGMRTAS